MLLPYRRLTGPRIRVETSAPLKALAGGSSLTGDGLDQRTDKQALTELKGCKRNPWYVSYIESCFSTTCVRKWELGTR